MRILGIETSCDETAASVVEDGRNVLSNVIATATPDLARYGGVFPEVAARKQAECIVPVIEKAMQISDLRFQDLEAIAVTRGPGLLTSLLVGVMAARTLASVWRKPLIGVHHTLGHLSSPWLERKFEPEFPILALSVSGGHTELWLRTGHTKGALLGRTLDDAAGEAFDKGAVLLGLPYPGGLALSQLAEGGERSAVQFPSPLAAEETCSFSFAGLKTALKYHLRDRGSLAAISEKEKRDIAASYQEAICHHLLSRMKHAIRLHPHIREVHLVGGVSANERLRELLQEIVGEAREPLLQIRTPARIEYCTDNAAMIAAAGYWTMQDVGKNAFATFETDASPQCMAP